MIEYIFHAAPTAVIVLAYFFRVEKRLTRIETILEIIMKQARCEIKKDETT